MPDRAVVDDVPTCELCDQPLTMTWSRGEGEVWHCKNHPAGPRALVALSRDRQWYTVLDKEAHRSGKRYFTLFEWSDFMGAYQWRDLIEDTGQDAHEVLAVWLEGRGDHP